MQDIYQFTHNIFATRQTELISYCHTDCRCDLCDHFGIFICKKIPDNIHVGLNTDCACRTYNPALSTVHAVGLCNFLIKCRCYQRFCSSICKINCIYCLHIVTHTYTVTAQNTFIRISHDRRRTVIDRL